jgi:hypothetical protein
MSTSVTFTSTSCTWHKEIKDKTQFTARRGDRDVLEGIILLKLAALHFVFLCMLAIVTSVTVAANTNVIRKRFPLHKAQGESKTK